jgi:translocation and assembly module TamB
VHALAAVLALGVLLWIVVVTGLGMSLVVPRVLAWAAPDGWTVEVGSVEGAWHSRIRLRDLELEGPATSASVEEVFVDYRVLPFLSRSIELKEVRIVRPAAHMRAARGHGEATREREGAGGLDALVSGSLLGDWALSLSRLDVRDAEATLERPDGTYLLSEARLIGSAELAPSATRIHIDTLAADVTPPAPPDSLRQGVMSPGRLLLAAHLDDGLLDVATLSFDSPRSHLMGSGELFLAPVPGLVDGVDFQLVADPLDLRDLPFELPAAWADQPRMTARVAAHGTGGALVVQAEAEGPGEAAVEARAILRTPSDTLFDGHESRVPTLEMRAEVQADLSGWSLGPFDGDVSAEIDMRLDSLSLLAPAELRAMLVHRVSADTLSGLLGNDLRIDLALLRESAPADTLVQRADAPSAGPLSATAVVYTASAARRRGDWREIGTLRASGTEERAAWEVGLELEPGSLAGRGGASWAGQRIEVVVDRLALEGFDVSALAGDFPNTDVTALLEGRLAGASLDQLSGTVALQVGPSSVTGTRVESATLRARLDPGAVAGAFMADAAGRTLSSDFELALADSLVSASLSRLRVSTPADTAAADSAPRAASALEVRGSATGTWLLGDERRATFSLTLDSALVAGLPMSEGRAEGRMVGDSIVAQASLLIQEVLSAPGSIDASLRARGTAPDEMVGQLEVRAVRAAAPDTVLARDTRDVGADSLAMTVTAEAPGRYVMDVRLLPAEGGRLDIEGSALVSTDSLTFDLLAGGRLDTPTSLLREATIDTLRLAASGARHAGAWDALQAQLLVRDAEWRGVTADTMRLVMSADSTTLRIDTLSVQSDVLTLAGGGTLPQRGGEGGLLELQASMQLEPLREVVEAELPQIGENALVATVTGTTDSLEVTTRLEVAAVSFGRAEIAGVSAEAWALIEPPFDRHYGIAAGAADVELDAIALPDTDVQNLTASLSGSPDSLYLEMSARVDGERTGELVASIDPRPDGRTARLERLHLQLDEDEWELAQPARVSYADGYALREFHLVAGEQAILIDGGLTGAGALDLSVQMDSTDIGTVTDLLGLPRLDGWLGGTVSLQGTADAPSGTAELAAGFHVEGRPPTTADLRLRSDGSEVVTNVLLRDRTGGTLSVNGSVPLAALRPGGPRTTELDLRVSARSFDVSSAVAFVDSELLATLEGRVEGDLEVAGSLEAPSLQGPLELRDGRARLPALGVTWEEMTLHAHGEGNQLVVDSARLETGAGYASLTGRARMDGAVALDLAVYLQDFQAIRNEEYRAVVSGNLSVGGTPTAPVVEGDIRVESLDIYLGETASRAGLMDVELTEEDLETLRQRFGYMPASRDDERRASDFITADLTVELSRNSWLRKRAAPDMAVAFSGELEVELRPGADPQVHGTVTTIEQRGYIAQFGRRFEPREGTVTFAGPPESARVDLSATYTVPSYSTPNDAEATIVLSVQGTQDDLSLTLTSVPPMENADIVSYIATGRPAASAVGLGGAGAGQPGAEPGGVIAEAGAGVALNQIVGAVERAAQEGVGLDVVEIRRKGIRGATLVAGKYLSPRLYVGFAQPITRREGDGLSLAGEGQSSEIEVEYQVLRGLLLNLEGSDSALRIFLRGRVAY